VNHSGLQQTCKRQSLPSGKRFPILMYVYRSLAPRRRAAAAAIASLAAAACAAATTLFVALAPPASAATLFGGDFDDGNSSGWTTSGGNQLVTAPIAAFEYGQPWLSRRHGRHDGRHGDESS
jgi:hypothetical protein